jgi:alpha-mannosidase
VRIRGDALVLSACKQAEEGDSLIVRLYNPTATVCHGSLTSLVPLVAAYLTSLEERRIQPLPISEAATMEIEVAPKAIVTLELVP